MTTDTERLAPTAPAPPGPILETWRYFRANAGAVAGLTGGHADADEVQGVGGDACRGVGDGGPQGEIGDASDRERAA